MLALKSDRRRPGPFEPWEAMTQIPFQKLVTLACNLHTGRAQTFAIIGVTSISISFATTQGTSRSRYLHRIHDRTAAPKMSPYDLRAIDNVSHRPQDNKPFNPEHLLPTQRKKAFVVRLHRGHLVLAVGEVCRCTRPNIGWKARYAVRGDGLGCFHTVQTRRRRPHTPGRTLGAVQRKTLCQCLSND
jgi:hypothetical protein